VINKYRRGEWILTAETVPPGYRLVDDQPVLDHDQVDGVRHLITLLADPALSARQVVDAAGEIRLTSPTIERVHGAGATDADVRRADARVRSLIRAVPARTTCLYEAHLPNPFPGVDPIGELDVDNPSPDRPHGGPLLAGARRRLNGPWLLRGFPARSSPRGESNS
jgi:hypothetical protein